MGPETIELITKDLIRTCRIPRHEDPSGLTVVLPRGKFSQLKESCKVKTREQAQQEQENISKKKLTDMEESQRRKDAKLLLNQIKGNTEEKILNEERKDQETKIVLQKLQELHQLDEKEIAEKKVRKDNLRKELDYYSQQQQKHRERTVRQEKQAAFKAMEYQKQKDERDIALE